MEPKNGDLEDDFPFQTGDFEVPVVHFPGCTKFQGRNVFNFEGFEPFVGPEMSVNLMTGVPPWCFRGREFLTTSTSTSRVIFFSANFRCELV